jgi:hypothetical protein
MDDDLQKAITLVKSGQKKQAGQILAEIVKQQPNNESAWFLLAGCVNVNQQKLYCLNKVSEINPQNDAALEAIQKLQQKPEFQFVDNSPINYQTNGNSIASLITGILGWVFGIITVFVGFAVSSSDNQFFIWFPMILAVLSWFISIVTGFTGLKQIKNDDSQKGDGLSKSGIIMSGIGCVFPLGFILLLLLFISPSF